VATESEAGTELLDDFRAFPRPILNREARPLELEGFVPWVISIFGRMTIS